LRGSWYCHHRNCRARHRDGWLSWPRSCRETCAKSTNSSESVPNAQFTTRSSHWILLPSSSPAGAGAQPKAKRLAVRCAAPRFTFLQALAVFQNWLSRVGRTFGKLSWEASCAQVPHDFDAENPSTALSWAPFAFEGRVCLPTALSCLFGRRILLVGTGRCPRP
jgi:hypothetical protein